MFNATGSAEELIKALEEMRLQAVSSRDGLDALDLRMDEKIKEESISTPANDNSRFSKAYQELKRAISENAFSISNHFRSVKPPKEEPPKPEDWEYYNR